MSKAKITRKWIAQNYTCVSVGYCDLYYLLVFQSPSFYTCGVYGWNCDVYTFGDYAITTGYRSMISHVDGLSYEKTREYNKKAESVYVDNSIEYEVKRDKINALLAEYLKEVFNDTIRVF